VHSFARGGTSWTGSVVDAEVATDACGQELCPSFTQMLDGARVSLPDIVFISGGQNAADRTPDELAGDISLFFTVLEHGYPDAAVYATSAISPEDETSDIYAVMNEHIEQAVTAIGGTYLDLGQPLAGHPEYLADAGHPNDAGHRAIADAVLAAWPPHG